MDFLSSLVQEAITILYNISASFGFANYGFAIILLTVIVKMATYPLTKKQIQSMKAMQRLQPKMKAIQEKYKGDKMKANEALAQLYKSEGVNPLAGCLPLLIQMPILIGIFYGIRDFQYAGSPLFMGLDISRSLSEFMSAGGPEMYAYAVLPVFVLFFITFILVIVFLSVSLIHCRRKLRQCHENLLRCITENLELKKNIPNSERTNLFNLPDITPEEFIKVMDMMLKRMIKNR